MISLSFFRNKFNNEYVVAILVAIGLCFQRISMPVGSICWGGALALTLCKAYKLYKAKALHNFRFIKGYFIAWLICFLSMLPSIFLNEGIGNSTKQLLEMWVYRISPFFVVSLCINDKKYLRKIFLAFFIFISLDNLLAVYQVFAGLATRGWGFGGNSLNLASINAVMIPMLLVGLLDDFCSHKDKYVLAGALACCMGGLFAGLSRGAWLSAGIVSAIVLGYYCMQNKKVIVITAILVCALGFGVYKTPNLMHRLANITNTTTDKSNTARINLWRGCLAMAKDNPVGGIGLDNFGKAYKEAYHYKDEKYFPHAHNNYMMLLAETGVIGFISFCLLCFYILLKNIKDWFHKKSIYSMMIWTGWLSYMIFGCFDYIFDHSAVSKIWWFLLGTLLVLSKGDTDENQE